MQNEFLFKAFEDYSTTEGFLLLFLLIGFCALIWLILRDLF